MAKKILVVDDDKDIRTLLRYNLEREGFQVLISERGEGILEKVRLEKPDLIFLDLMLPGMDGLEICRLLKSSPETRTIPVVMLTAKTEEADVVVGLELGADDYITKPFSPKVLLARARALLRRGQDHEKSAEKIVIGSLSIDHEKHEVRLSSNVLALTATEFNLLSCLASRPGRVFTRDELLNRVWNDEALVVDRTVDVHMASLRKKLGKYADWLETVRGFGYRFQVAGDNSPKRPKGENR